MRLKSIVITMIVLLAGVALVFVGSRFVGGNQANAAEGIQTVVVERGTLRASVDATGSVVPETRLELSFKSAGRVAEIIIVEGDQVEAGEVLARLETADLEQAIIQAQANLAISEAQLAQTEEGAIAAISLVVGGIGIMNIMLVSVTERTREIGIRKAVGAKRRDILMQFLVEAVVLSVIGGLLGILLGAGIAILVEQSGLMTTVVSADAVLLATGFSVAVGLFFGIYPSMRAARLHPIEALRYE